MPEQAQNTNRAVAHPWLVLAVSSIGLLLISLDMSVLYTALPALTEDLDASVSEKLWIINAYPLAVAGLLLGAGTLGDRIGHRRMFLAGLVIFGSASAFAAFATSAEMLIAGRALLGVGAATMMPATLALLRLAFDDPRELNLAIGVWGSMSVVGVALGPIISGALLEAFWWGSVFLINVPIVLGALVAAVKLAPRVRGDASKSWDPWASALVMIGLVGLVFAVKEVTKPERDLLVAGIAAAVSLIGFRLFLRRQASQETPLIDLAIFRNPIVLSGVLGAGVAMFAFAGVQLMTTQRFQLIDDFSPLQTGLLTTPMALGTLATAAAAGSVLHRVGYRSLISGGFVLTAIGALAVAVMIEWGPGWAIPGLFVAGGGLGSTMAVASSAIIGNVPRAQAGMASSVEEVSYELGSLAGVAILGSIVTAVYTTSIDLPSGAPSAAKDSIDAARAVAESRPGAASDALLDAATSAFSTGYAVVMVIVIVALSVAAAVTARLLRGGPRANAPAAATAHAEAQPIA